MSKLSFSSYSGITLSAMLGALSACPRDVPPPVSPCEQVTCSNHGVCILQGGDTATCACDEGYVADNVNGLSCLAVGGGGGGGSADAGSGTGDDGGSSGGSDAGSGGGEADAGSGGGGADAGPGGGGADAGPGGGDASDAGPGDDPVEACDLPYCDGDDRAVEDGIVCVDEHYSFHPSLAAQGGHSRMVRTSPIGGEPVVTDQLSELMWTGCAIGLSGAECRNGSRIRMNYNNHVTLCEELQWGGFDDWVRPTGHLQNALVDRRDRNPIIPSNLFPNLTDPNGSYLSTGLTSSSNWQRMNMSTGEISWLNKTTQMDAGLCVRGTNGRVPAATHRRCFRTNYESTAEPTAEDLGTELTWSSCLAGTAGTTCQNGSMEMMTHSQAVAYCDDLVWGNHDDWTLPSLDQLLSLRSVRTGAGNNRAARFPEGAFAEVYTTVWTSSTVPREGYNNFIQFVLDFDLASSSSENQNRAVLCVRPGRWSYRLEYPERVCRETSPIRTAQDRSGDTLQLSRSQSDSPGEYIIEDAYLGLQWTGCPEGLSGNDCQNGAFLNAAGGEDFQLYCERLSYGNQDDWRAPTLVEIRSLFDYDSDTDDTIPEAVDAAFPALASHGLMDNGQQLHNRISSYRLGQNGVITGHNSGPRYCVRDHGDPLPRRMNQCVDTTAWTQTEGTVTISSAGLQYMACAHGTNGRGCNNGTLTQADWETANQNCQDLQWAGHTDWRLPTATEALHVYDTSRFASTNYPIDHRAFPIRGAAPADWTATTTDNDQARRANIQSTYRAGLHNTSRFICVRDSD